MPAAELAARINEALLSHDEDSLAVVEEAERRASAGCSVSARALVNGRDTLVELARGESSGNPPSSRVRARLLATAASQPSAPQPRVEPAAGDPEAVLGATLDPSRVVARLHVGTAQDAERTREVDALELRTFGQDAASEARRVLDRVLAQLDALLGYRLFLIAIIREELAYHPTTRGRTPEGVDFRQIPRDHTFCTHCVSAGAPVRVENAVREPFFRGNRMVWGFGAQAYAGVPLISSTGVGIGTLCCIHDEPRRIPDAHLDILAWFAVRVVAELERGRTPAMLDRIIAPTGAAAPSTEPLGMGSPDVYRESWFTRLLEIELGRARERGPDEQGRVAHLIVGGAELLYDRPRGAVGEGDVAGEIGSAGPGRYAILTDRAAGARAEGSSVAQWIAAASGSGV